jgi:hypothetical protein
MLSQIEFLSNTLGSYQAVARYLGYTTRQLYNIGKRVTGGARLSARVEIHLLAKVLDLKREELRKFKP